MSAFTTEQNKARTEAMTLYHECGRDVDALTKSLNKRPYSSVVSIASAFTDLPVRLNEARIETCGTWQLKMAVQVILYLIRTMADANPLFGERYDKAWVYLGRDLLLPAGLPDYYNQSSLPSLTIIEYWGRLDGSEISIILGSSKIPCIRVHVSELPGSRKHIHVAFRRLHRALEFAAA